MIAAVAVLATSMAAQAGLNLVVSAPTTTGGFDVYTVSAAWDGAGTPLQTINYSATDVNQEWYEIVPGVTYLDTVAPGSTGVGLIGARYAVDSHVLLPVVAQSGNFLTITTPSESMNAVPPTASGPGSMVGNFGYKGAAPTDASTDLFQIAVPSGAPLSVGQTGVMTIRLTAGDGAQSDFTLGTVPEPASMALLGLGALALIRRRK
jgi:hypothetical protein